MTFKPGATVVGVRSALLRVASDDADTPVLDIGLNGLALNGLEGSNEPPLADVVRTLGRNINVGWTGLTNDSPATGAQLEGDEVAAPLFTKAGTGPVTMKPVARFSPDEVLPFGWYLPTGASPERNEVAKVAAGQYQTLNPAIVERRGEQLRPGCRQLRGVRRLELLQPVELHAGRPQHRSSAHAARVYPAKDRAGIGDPEHLPGRLRGRLRTVTTRTTSSRSATSASPAAPAAPSRSRRSTSVPRPRPLAPGYTRDSGAAFTAGGSGWVNQATGTPQSMAALTRDRAGANLNQSTLILMQPTAAQSADGPGKWRYTLPNGSYKVTVGVGDPDFFDSVHRINVEGATVVPNFTANADDRSTTGTATVQVTDGVLDVDAVGGTNTKIQYLDIERPFTGTDTTAPVVTTELGGLQQSAGVFKGDATDHRAAPPTRRRAIAITSISVDGAPFTAYTEPVKITASGNHTVRARAQNGAGVFTTTALTVLPRGHGRRRARRHRREQPRRRAVRRPAGDEPHPDPRRHRAQRRARRLDAAHLQHRPRRPQRHRPRRHRPVRRGRRTDPARPWCPQAARST